MATKKKKTKGTKGKKGAAAKKPANKKTKKPVKKTVKKKSKLRIAADPKPGRKSEADADSDSTGKRTHKVKIKPVSRGDQITKVVQAKLGSVSFNGPTCSVGVDVSWAGFKDANEAHVLLTCAELTVALVGDPAQVKDEPSEQQAMFDTKEKCEFVARTNSISLKRETVSFTLQMSRKEYEQQCHLISRVSKKMVTLTLTVIGRVTEGDADSDDGEKK